MRHLTDCYKNYAYYAVKRQLHKIVGLSAISSKIPAANELLAASQSSDLLGRQSSDKSDHLLSTDPASRLINLHITYMYVLRFPRNGRTPIAIKMPDSIVYGLVS